MRFFRATWLRGASLSLEGMRRTFIGGSALSLFIIKQHALSPHARNTLELLKQYLTIEHELITQIPEPIKWLCGPWHDHHNSNLLYTRILDELIKLEFPDSCSYYWTQPTPRPPTNHNP